MTTIAWDGKTLAADRQINNAGLKSEAIKIRKLEMVGLVGTSGDCTKGRLMIEWLAAGANIDNFPQNPGDSTMLHITLDGHIHYYANAPVPLIMLDKQFAIGSGRDFALSAMWFGRNASEAVKFAHKFDVDTGADVDYFQLSELL
jgi:ATP-dependent protease HslVU (ClpYQ) peptidase subunit